MDNDKKIFSLFEVTRSIQTTIAERYKNPYWIKAEMNKLNFYRQSGHCYPELVEKKDGKVIAQVRGNLWKDDYLQINAKFQRILHEPLKDGIKILFLASISFHPEYGLALRIIDIDPSFTLGDLEREKQETIDQLIKEGIFSKNKGLPFPLLPQRIAFISVQTSKGYADMLKVFESAQQEWGYRFYHVLFPSLLQGEKSIDAIIQQLRKIKKQLDRFDVVAIVRGGGGDIGLSSYNNYELAKEIAMFPIPVITGIGHATNETVSEMVAYENAITPTRLAEFLVQKFHNFSIPVQRAEEKIIEYAKKLIREERARLLSEVKLFRSVTQNSLMGNRNALKENAQSLLQEMRFQFKTENNNLIQSSRKLLQGWQVNLKNHQADLKNLEKNLSNLSPDNILNRGFSITLFNGKALTSNNQVKPGAILKTILSKGTIISTVSENKQDNE